MKLPTNGDSDDRIKYTGSPFITQLLQEQ